MTENCSQYPNIQVRNVPLHAMYAYRMGNQTVPDPRGIVYESPRSIQERRQMLIQILDNALKIIDNLSKEIYEENEEFFVTG
jgi:hypothetical protein